MFFFGSNEAYAIERVELSGDRAAGPLTTDDDPFPFGAGGLVPVATSRRKKGGIKTVYAFPFAQGEYEPADEGEAAGQDDTGEQAPALDDSDDGLPADDDAAACSADDAQPADEDAAEQDNTPIDLREELFQATDFVNCLLAEAAELSGHDFGAIGALVTGIPEKGYGFTRVELVGPDQYGRPAPAPVRLYLETSEHPGEPESLSAVIEYDEEGYPIHVLMTEYGQERLACRAVASLALESGEFVVKKVERALPDEEPEVLYRRYPSRHPRTCDDWDERDPDYLA